jgi:hypothetical protein
MATNTLASKNLAAMITYPPTSVMRMTLGWRAQVIRARTMTMK